MSLASGNTGVGSADNTRFSNLVDNKDHSNAITPDIEFKWTLADTSATTLEQFAGTQTALERLGNQSTSFESHTDALGYESADFRPVDSPAVIADAGSEGSGTVTTAQQLAASGDLDAAVAYMIKQPDQIDAVVQAYAAQRPGAIPDLLEAGGEVVASHKLKVCFLS